MVPEINSLNVLCRLGAFMLTGMLMACGGGSGGGESQTAERSSTERFAVAAATQVIPDGDVDCPNGGVLVETGIDENGNGVLDPEEVDDTHKVCNGQDGRTGASGATGPAGPTGPAGFNALVAIERVNETPDCPAGGLRIDSGLDASRDGILDPDEIQYTRYVCDSVLVASAWEDPVPVEFHYGGIARRPVMAMNGSGDAVAAWSSEASLGSRITVNYYDTDKGGWNSALEVAADQAFDYQVAIRNDGEAWVTWDQNGSVWVRRYLSGSGEWSGAENLGAGGFPVVAANDNGDVMITWVVFDGNAASLWAARYIESSGSWSSSQVTAVQPVYMDISTIAMDQSGDAIVVWDQLAGARMDVWAVRYDAGTGIWDTPVLLEDSDTESAEAPQVAMDDTGNAIVVWEQDDGGRSHIWARHYDAATDTWHAPRLIEDHATPESAMLPMIAMAGNGDAIVVWSQYDGARSDVWSVHYHAHTGTWSSPVRLDLHDNGQAFGVGVAINGDGDAIAVWQEFDGLRTNIWSNRWLAGDGWQDAELVEQEAADGYSPAVAIDDAGAAMVVWEWRANDSSRHIVASRRPGH